MAFLEAIMEKLKFFAPSSSSDQVYILEARRSAKGLRFSCTCQAADNGLHCKHRIGLLHGPIESDDPATHEQVATLRQWYAGSRAIELIGLIERTEAEQEALRKFLNTAKKELARELMG